MKIPDNTWQVTSTPYFRLAVQQELQPGAEMSFTGLDAPEPLWTPGSIKVWAGTFGKWERRITIGDDDVLQACKNDINNLFPAQAFSTVDPLFNNLDTVTYDDNEAVWMWQPTDSIYPAMEGVLNDHVSKYPFVQTVTEIANIACLIAHPDYTWNSSMISTNIEEFIITKKSPECWVVSLFGDQVTTSGKVLERGKFYKLTQDITLQKTVEHDRVVSLWI